MVVVPRPSVKGLGAFAAGAVDRAVGPTAEQGADEAFGFAVGLWAPRAGAEVVDPEQAAGDGVNGGDVARPVIGQELLDGDAVTGVERDRSPEEGHDCGGLS